MMKDMEDEKNLIGIPRPGVPNHGPVVEIQMQYRLQRGARRRAAFTSKGCGMGRKWGGIPRRSWYGIGVGHE